MTAPTRHPTLKDWQHARILDALSEGFGVEDIAERTGWSVDAIREFVFSMPAELRREIYAREGAEQ
ncbi:hypothetical protein [Paracoccus siganidrum]|uniref:Helix-turn-helix domain-containing protein n=1 Tax=Paracoccus siganidrum TaxID=1276757 RepID=A0A419A763_9RHOB|nr:hypothetical protein [Paracoccus siganidrum]RJL15299.1 hypothetical protein D3P05_10835 [Paracoccus siganidrum]RMC39360.1 hypothetical protein C9E82_05115 [Paracoccus siganidrum]